VGTFRYVIADVFTRHAARGERVWGRSEDQPQDRLPRLAQPDQGSLVSACRQVV